MRACAIACIIMAWVLLAYLVGTHMGLQVIWGSGPQGFWMAVAWGG